ncbi:MAG: putative toxin-antitoxin system toxin component, PIN family [Saprospirales bacterium]|nr:putative toxin-antitoxin system toxin component, PIN family [Saprospirales bacterium]
MQNLILDTNIIVSALLSRNSPPALIIDELVLNRKVNLCLSEAIMAEYIDVLGRQKFARVPGIQNTRRTVTPPPLPYLKQIFAGVGTQNH